MALMTWDDSFSVGVKPMDDQHKVLVQSLNDLHAAMMNGQAKQVTAPLLTRLVKYTGEHFSAEEALLTRTGYPGITAHRAHHADLKREVTGYVEWLDRGDITLYVYLLNFLRDWLIKHIQQEDRDYGPWLNQHGVR
jgi:hemerythrin